MSSGTFPDLSVLQVLSRNAQQICCFCCFKNSNEEAGPCCDHVKILQAVLPAVYRNYVMLAAGMLAEVVSFAALCSRWNLRQEPLQIHQEC